MEKKALDRRFPGLVLAVVIVTFLLMVAGNAVRVSGASTACPDWPTCYSQWVPPRGASLFDPTAIQYQHRALALLAAILTGVSATWSMRFSGQIRGGALVAYPLLLAFGIILLQALLGAGLITETVSSFASGMHMALALVSFGLVTTALVTSFYLRYRSDHHRLVFRSRFAWLTLFGLICLFLLLISGTVVSANGSGQDCLGWPLCSDGLPNTTSGWIAIANRVVVLLTGGVLCVQLLSAWKTQRSQIVLLPAATTSFLLLVGQSFIGAANASRGFPVDLVGLHAAISACLWSVQIVLFISAGMEARSREEEILEAAEPLSFGRRLKDFWILSKPIIVALLLVTTYAGMVVGGKSLPSAPLMFWTLLGGALAAGGASALNQYIDRDIDRAMQRTAKRPLPDGRLKPAEGLAYGIGACMAAFFIMAVMVNLLAAVLSLAGMIYYVLLYSVWLKRLTVQNIVIGGGAGAIPPLVGWAAATGALNIPSLLLFAIIFLCTPPHFWALALVRKNDYARGGVPMMPVVRGETETRRQILIYTVELVALTLLLPILDILGIIYLLSAVVLGAWLIHTAWKVMRAGGNKTAWQMYRYSSMYLAFLMLAMVIDVLV